MAIRLRPDGTVEADSVAELLMYQRARQGAGKPDKGQSHGNQNEAMPDAAAKLVRVLFPHSNGLDTMQVAKELDVSGRGVGGSVTSLLSWGKRRGLTRTQLIMKGRRSNENGKQVRKIQIAERLRKMIEKGEVPDMKINT